MQRSMDATAAQEFSESFGMIGAGWWRQIAWAKQQGIPDALGMTTRDWVEHYVGGWARLAIEDRREAVLELVAAPDEGGLGLSQRDAAEVLGVHEATISRDLADASGTRTADHESSTEPLQMQVPEAETPAVDADILMAHVAGLSDLRMTLKPDALVAGLHVTNRPAFAKRLRRIGRYLDTIATRLEQES